jgi:transposase
MTFISFDSHKRYTTVCVQDKKGRIQKETRIEHEPGCVRGFLEGCPSGNPVALETLGNWYWIVDEIEKAGMVPKLVHAGKAKLLMGMTNKTDKLDARGLNRLQRAGVLPTVWIPPGELRDQRELVRGRMALVKQRTALKNRLHATLAKYAVTIDEVSDIFGKKGRKLVEEALKRLPPETAYTSGLMLEQLDEVQARIRMLEKKVEEVFKPTPALDLLRTIPGIGPILSVVVLTEVGDVSRFSTSAKLASYSGTTPRVHSSGGKTRHGRLRRDTNQYLKWAFMEAANAVSGHIRSNKHRHVGRLYKRIRGKKGHGKAIGAVARHLAEATFWVLKKMEPYKEPEKKEDTSTEREAR